MKIEIVKFVCSSLACQKSKIEHKKSLGRLQPLKILVWKWENITMKFLLGLPKSPSGCDTIWVIIYHLIKSTHFLQMNMEYPLKKLAHLYIKKKLRLHGVPMSSFR